MKRLLPTTLLLLLLPLCLHSRSFKVDWENDRFLKDGEQFSYYSGGMHYFRVPMEYWEDRMYKIKMAGMNTIQTYISWNSHEEVEGKFTFEGGNNFTHFLTLAHNMGLSVVLRPGPYICAEWRFGGLPYWLLNKPGIQFRMYNEPYIEAIAKWFAVLLPMVKPFLYTNGGPIITVQVENEYGAYGPWVCDKKYLQFILDQYKKYLGEDVVYFTLDNTNVKRLECGNLPGLLKALDFGPTKIPYYQNQMLKKYQEHGPFVNTEFWAGWFDVWGGGHANVNASKVAQRLDEMIQLNGSVNFYMFEGGTNFGYSNGAMSKKPGRYNVRVTSYDYNSALNEAGDPTDKYYAVRKVMSKYVKLPSGPVPVPAPKWKSSPIQFTRQTSLFDNLPSFTTCVTANLPLTMEQLKQSDGFILYQLQWSGPVKNITLYGVHDRAVVYIDRQRIGAVDRRFQLNGSVIVPPNFGSRFSQYPNSFTVTVFVENLGRVNHGSYMGIDFKGITMMVTFDGVNVNSKEWTVCPLPMNSPEPAMKSEEMKLTPPPGAPYTPTIYCSLFETSNKLDTFLDPRGWGKGVAFLNGFNLGRYWPTEGPQVTLYTPGVYLKSRNTLCVFEIDEPSEMGTMQFIDEPMLGRKDEPDKEYSYSMMEQREINHDD